MVVAARANPGYNVCTFDLPPGKSAVRQPATYPRAFPRACSTLVTQCPDDPSNLPIPVAPFVSFATFVSTPGKLLWQPCQLDLVILAEARIAEFWITLMQIRRAELTDEAALGSIRRRSILKLAAAAISAEEAAEWATGTPAGRIARAIREHDVWVALEDVAIGWVEVHQEGAIQLRGKQLGISSQVSRARTV